MQNDLQKLLLRTNLKTPFDAFLEDVKKAYNFKEIYRYIPILDGYEEANIKLITEKGNYYIKIFAKERTLELVESYVNVLVEAEKKNVALIRLVEGENGFFNTIQESIIPVYYYITHSFEGEDFSQIVPTLDDMINIINEVAKFNTLYFPILPGYDSWGNKNLVSEYQQTVQQIPKDTIEMVKPIVDEMSQLDDTKFSKSIIHGDLQRKNVLKNKKGEYCLVDLSCMRIDAKVYELSIFLAWFCLDENNWKDRENIIKTVISKYSRVHTLSQKEMQSLPLLIKAAYAGYLRKTSWLIGGGDISQETRDWFEKSKKMLKLCKGL